MQGNNGTDVFLDSLPAVRSCRCRNCRGPARPQGLEIPADKWGKAVIKPDILAGRKGKAGLVKVVEDPNRALQEINRMLNAISAAGCRARLPGALCSGGH